MGPASKAKTSKDAALQLGSNTHCARWGHQLSTQGGWSFPLEPRARSFSKVMFLSTVLPGLVTFKFQHQECNWDVDVPKLNSKMKFSMFVLFA